MTTTINKLNKAITVSVMAVTILAFGVSQASATVPVEPRPLGVEPFDNPLPIGIEPLDNPIGPYF